VVMITMVASVFSLRVRKVSVSAGSSTVDAGLRLVKKGDLDSQARMLAISMRLARRRKGGVISGRCNLPHRPTRIKANSNRPSAGSAAA
jgi:hypothetical protein